MYFFRLIEKSTKKDQGSPITPCGCRARSSPCATLFAWCNLQNTSSLFPNKMRELVLAVSPPRTNDLDRAPFLVLILKMILVYARSLRVKRSSLKTMIKLKRLLRRCARRNDHEKTRLKPGNVV
jgi:hypothetical protein